MRRIVSFGPALVVILAAVVTLVAAPAAVRRISHAQTEATIQLARAQLGEDDILERMNQAVRNIARSVEPSVVHISAGAQGFRQRNRLSQGSGWVFDAAGHIITNAHVVRSSPEINVQFYDGRTARATLVGVDTTTDIAVIRVADATEIFPSQRATGVELQQGDRVYAFGSPFGFKFSMSEGIVSGLGRDPRGVIASSQGYTNFIQTDAAVNPGNSGGPLIDVRGRVVGMNVAIATGASPSGANEGQSAGISFAIPLETIEFVAEQLIDRGTVEKGFLGIEHEMSDDENRNRMEARGYFGKGAILTRVTPSGPADLAGLKPNDIVTELGGRKVTSPAGLRQIITNNRPGRVLSVKVWRNGKEEELQVSLASQLRSVLGRENVENALAGFGLRELSNSPEGIIIGEVVKDSMAEQVGLSTGQVILNIEGKEAHLDSLWTVLAEEGFANGRRLNFTVQDAGAQKRIEVQYRP